jgi:hypothetical protein
VQSVHRLSMAPGPQAEYRHARPEAGDARAQQRLAAAGAIICREAGLDAPNSQRSLALFCYCALGRTARRTRHVEVAEPDR